MRNRVMRNRNVRNRIAHNPALLTRSKLSLHLLCGVAFSVLSCRPVQYVGTPEPVAPAAGAATDSTATPPRTPPARATPPRSGAAAPSRSAPRAPVTPVLYAPPELPREFRAVWVASVANIDWPSKRTLTTAEQQRELVALFDQAAALRLNAVIFQVRPAADALYASNIEPWSEYLTGTQGRAPDPYWDPLEFAVQAAHERNMELHAWFNPYRARHTDAKSPLSNTHISKTHPALIKPYGGYLWMDPGEPAVRARTLKVVMDVVKRYDIDGVHIDDYFYPYPETTRRGSPIPFPDKTSWTRYQKSGGRLSQSDWRRQNVDLLVEQLHDSIHAAKPWVKFGISPFGIWRPGYPAQIQGLDAYEKLYADARKWLHEGWLDYFSPQLYWPTTKTAQAYPVLLDWWAQENIKNRHLWPGNFTSRAAGVGSGAFSVSELLEQIRVTRAQGAASGNVHFSMKSFMVNQGGMNDSLSTGLYATDALVPVTPWLTTSAPPIPSVKLVQEQGTLKVILGTTSATTPWQWLVQVRREEGWSNAVLRGTISELPFDRANGITQVTVRTVNRLGNLSPPISIPTGNTATGDSNRGR